MTLNSLLKQQKVKSLPIKKLITYKTKGNKVITMSVFYNDPADVGDTAVVKRIGRTAILFPVLDADIILNDTDND